MDMEQLLIPLVKDVMDDKFATKQRAFQQHIRAVESCIDMFGWKKTVDFLNEKMNTHLSINTYKTMVYRSKKKKDKKTNEKSVSNKNINNPLSNLSKNKPFDYNPIPDKSRIYGDDE